MKEQKDESIRRIDESQLCASITTTVAYRTAFSKHFCDSLAEATPISPESQEILQMAVSEAVSNGAIHGNLEVSSNDSGKDWESAVTQYSAYYDAIEERLKDPCFADRRIECAARWDDDQIEVSIWDQGQGFDFWFETKKPSTRGAFGRGLQIINAVASSVEISHGGRRITMTFSR